MEINERAFQVVIEVMKGYRPDLSLEVARSIVTCCLAQGWDYDPLAETSQDVWWSYKRAVKQLQQGLEHIVVFRQRTPWSNCTASVSWYHAHLIDDPTTWGVGKTRAEAVSCCLEMAGVSGKSGDRGDYDIIYR